MVKYSTSVVFYDFQLLKGSELPWQDFELLRRYQFLTSACQCSVELLPLLTRGTAPRKLKCLVEQIKLLAQFFNVVMLRYIYLRVCLDCGKRHPRWLRAARPSEYLLQVFSRSSEGPRCKCWAEMEYRGYGSG